MNFLKNMLSTKDGEVSHKRVLGSVGFLAMTATLVANIFTNRVISPSPELVNAVEYLTMAAMFGTVVEKFSKFNNNNTTQQ